MPNIDVAVYQAGRHVGMARDRPVRKTPHGCTGVVVKGWVYPVYERRHGHLSVDLADTPFSKDPGICPISPALLPFEDGAGRSTQEGHLAVVSTRADRSEPSPLFLEVVLRKDLSTRTTHLLRSAQQSERWQSLTFESAMADRSSLMHGLLKIPGMGLKTAREVIQTAESLEADTGAQRGLLVAQGELTLAAPTLEDETAFFDALRWQRVSPRLQNALATAEGSCAQPRSIADFLENRHGFRSHVLKQPNVGKKTENELLDVIERLITWMKKESNADQNALYPAASKETGHPLSTVTTGKVISVAEILESLLSELAPREADVVRRRYGLGGAPRETLEQVGQAYGLTRERIRQVEKQAWRHLRLGSAARSLKSSILDCSQALWATLTSDADVLLVDELPDAIHRLGNDVSFAIELAWESVHAWLSATRHSRGIAWYQDQDTERRLSELTSRLKQEATDRLLPFPLASLAITAADSTLVRSACQLVGLHIASGYVCSGRPRPRKLRAIRLHALLGQRRGDIQSVGSLVERYRRRFTDDPCSTRDALIVMGDAPHLFIDVMEDQWSSMTDAMAVPRTIEGDAPDCDATNASDAEMTATADASIVSTIERTLEACGPLRFTDLRTRVCAELVEGQARNSIGPVLITSGRFGRIAPGLYGLPHQITAVARGDLFPDALLAIDQCRWFVTALHAGSQHGDFPAWTLQLEIKLCQWAESKKIDGALFESLLAVVDPMKWSGTLGDRDYWARIKSKRAHYWLREPAPPLSEAPPDLDRLLAAGIEAARHGGTNWIAVNRVCSKRVDHTGAASTLSLMVASGMLLPSDHWQSFHRASADLARIIDLLAATRMRRGTLLWSDAVGKELIKACRSRSGDLGWVPRSDLFELITTLTDAETPTLAPALHVESDGDSLEDMLKQVRIRRQAALVESLL